MTVKLLTEQHLEFLSLKEAQARLSLQCTLVKMPHCRKSHVAAHLRWYHSISYFKAKENATLKPSES